MKFFGSAHAAKTKLDIEATKHLRSIASFETMLVVARCCECGEVKPCIKFKGGRRSEPVEFYYCPECDEARDEFLTSLSP